MKVAVLILLALLAAVIVPLLLLYRRYAGSPAARWKRRVRAAVGEQEARLRTARRDLRAAGEDSDLRRLREQHLERHVRGIPVENLIRHPGIGPVTASRLRDAGLTDLAALSRGHLAGVPGIGPVREKDLRSAIRQERREAESRFDAGACPEAVAFSAERQKREADARRRRLAAEQAVREAESALDALRGRVKVARGITFLGHLLGRPPAGLTDELMARPLVEPTPRPIPAERPGPPPAPAPPPVPVARVLESPPTALAAPAEPALAPPAPDTSPLGRLRAAAGFGLAVARADGRVAASERRQVRAFLERRYAQNPDLAAGLDGLLAEVAEDVPTLGDALWAVKQAIPADGWPELYRFAVSVVDAAGERNAREVECLARVAEELGIGAAPGTAAVPAAKDLVPVEAASASGEAHAAGTAALPGGPSALAEPDARAALEIAPDVPLSVDLIRRQYRLLADRFAPDRFASHGPEFVRMAADRRARIEAAARHLLAAYNEPLDPPAAQPPADPRHNPDLDEVFGA